MTKHDLILGVTKPKKTKGAPASSGASAVHSKIPLDIKKEIFARDDHTCAYCGFTSKKYQEIEFKNHNIADLSHDNLITACIFCHQCLHLEKVDAMKSGMLIWLPEISQADLHHMARAIFVGQVAQGPAADAAKNALSILNTRREKAQARIQTDNPVVLATVLSDYLTGKHYKARGEKLDGIRLMPANRRIIKEGDLEFNQFPQILAYWRSKDGPFGGKIPKEWISIYQKIEAQAA